MNIKQALRTTYNWLTSQLEAERLDPEFDDDELVKHIYNLIYLAEYLGYIELDKNSDPEQVFEAWLYS